MARRNIPQNESDALKAEKAKAESLKSQANAANAQVKTAGSALSQIKKDTEEAVEAHQHMVDAIAVKREQTEQANTALEAAQTELRKVEGALSEAESELVKVRDNTQKAQSEHTRNLEVLKGDHEAKRKSYEGMRAKLMDEMGTLKSTIEGLEKAKKVLSSEISQIESQYDAVKRDVLPLIPQRKEELDTLERELLVKRVEVKDTGEELATVKGQIAEAKRELGQVNAEKSEAEKQTQKQLAKLVEKEDEVDKKMRAYRTLKERVDQESIRLKRREEDLILENHLSETKQKVNNS